MARRGPKLHGKEKKIRQNLTLDPDVIEQAKAVAEEAGISLSLWVEGLMREGISRSNASAITGKQEKSSEGG